MQVAIHKLTHLKGNVRKRYSLPYPIPRLQSLSIFTWKCATVAGCVAVLQLLYYNISPLAVKGLKYSLPLFILPCFLISDSFKLIIIPPTQANNYKVRCFGLCFGTEQNKTKSYPFADNAGLRLGWGFLHRSNASLWFLFHWRGIGRGLLFHPIFLQQTYTWHQIKLFTGSVVDQPPPPN